MTKIGYTRVSTTEQNTDRQDLGDISRLFEDKASGANADRPALNEMLAFIREVTSKGATVTFLTERLTFSGSDDAMSTLMLQMMGSFAQFERSMIKKRQAEGIAVAKDKGVYQGRKPSIDREAMTNMLNAGSSITSVARALGISRQSVYRIRDEVGV